MPRRALSDRAFVRTVVDHGAYRSGAATRLPTRCQMMRDQPLLPDDGKRVEHGIDCQMPFPALKPRGEVVCAHYRHQSQGQPMDGGFERLARPVIQDWERSIHA